MDGAELARIIRERDLAVVVPRNSKCASACFLMLAAAPRRFAANDALIGVHGASDDGKDTAVAMAMTTAMARAAADLGVPPPIVGKMVGTAPSRVEWLTPEDLTSMGVVIYDDADSPLGSFTSVVAGLAPSTERAKLPSYGEGRDERRAWEAWLAALRGPYRHGALFWVAQHLKPAPASCLGPNGVSRGEFTTGCEDAKQRLAASDAKSRASSDYRMGWSSLDNLPATPLSTPVKVEAEFQGAIFCGHEPAQLTLKLLSTSDPAHHRAVYTLRPDSSGGRALSGSFTIEGRFDLAGGAIDLRPIAAAQPDSEGLVGLQGRSVDGGKTFAGRVTANARCTMFTLKRTS